jgi:hypothetical protein
MCTLQCPSPAPSVVDYFRCSPSTLAHGLHHFLLPTGTTWPSAIPSMLNLCDVLVRGYDCACRNSPPLDSARTVRALLEYCG